METALVQFLLPIKKSLTEKTADEIIDSLEGLTKAKGDVPGTWLVLPARPAATYLTVGNTGRDGDHKESKRNLFAPRSPEE